MGTFLVIIIIKSTFIAIHTPTFVWVLWFSFNVHKLKNSGFVVKFEEFLDLLHEYGHIGIIACGLARECTLELHELDVREWVPEVTAQIVALDGFDDDLASIDNILAGLGGLILT